MSEPASPNCETILRAPLALLVMPTNVVFCQDISSFVL